ncbi:MAG: hypothetical protein AAF604_24545 [Acidobacteriota bacterium]
MKNHFSVHRLLWLLLVLLLAPVSASAIEVCGNGICNPTGFPSEDINTCPQDCGGDPNPGCNQHFCDDCDRPNAATDLDADGVPDSLEYDIAHKFFPSVHLQGHSEDRSEAYLYRNRSIPYMVNPLPPQGLCNEVNECLEVRWGIAFKYDHGDTWFDIGNHRGDSEMYAAVVQRTTDWLFAKFDIDDWRMVRDFTASHFKALGDSSKIGVYGNCPTSCSAFRNDPAACDAKSYCQSNGYCSGYHGGCYGPSNAAACNATSGCTWNPSCRWKESTSCYSASPKTQHVDIFSAESKHALYHSDSECDSGGWNWSDDCPRTPSTAYDMRQWKDDKLQNVGRPEHHPLNQTRIQHPNFCGTYDVWGGKKFGGAASYKSHFEEPLPWALD